MFMLYAFIFMWISERIELKRSFFLFQTEKGLGLCFMIRKIWKFDLANLKSYCMLIIGTFPFILNYLELLVLRDSDLCKFEISATWAYLVWSASD